MEGQGPRGYLPTPMTTLAFGIEPSNKRFRLRLARYRYLADALAHHLPAGPSLVLDAGCGKGRLGLYWRCLKPAGKSARIVGLDRSPLRLAMARDRGYALILQGDLLRRLPFRDRSFDAVICEQVIEHFPDAQVHFIISELARALKPGGIALVGTPVFTRFALLLSPVWKRLNPLLRRLRGGTPPQHLQHFLLRDVERLLDAHGLHPERACGFRLFSLPRSWLEDFEWYYRLHRWAGSRLPGLCTEVNISARRAGS